MPRLLLLICVILMTGNIGLSQTPSMEETLDYINGKLGSSFEVTVVKGTLTVKYFQSGELFRDDQALCKDLDPKKCHYDAAEKVFSVNCVTGRDCVIRVYHIREIRRDYARISFAKELDPASVEGLSKAFAHMIMMVNNIKYKETVSFQ